MGEFFETLKSSMLEFKVLDVVDIFLVAIFIYGLLKITSKTRASQVLKGLGIIIFFALVCGFFKLTTVTWLLNYLVGAGAILLVILFQPEIRRALEKVGRGKILDMSFNDNNKSEDSLRIEQIERAILNMSIRKTGALIVFEQKTGLRDVIESGNTLDARISSELIENIFFPNSPMHDGAMIIKGDKIVAAGCFLPLSDNRQLSSELGTRHRAALGMSEISDSVVIIVSEETGVISKAREGTLNRYIDRKALKQILEGIYSSNTTKVRVLGGKLKRRAGKK